MGCNAQSVEDTEKPWEGAWIGAVDTPPYPDLMHFRYDSAGWVRFYYNEVDMHKLSGLELNNTEVSFPIAFGDFQGSFQGTRQGNVIKGVLKKGGTEYKANLVKVIPEGLDRIGEMVGYFEFGPGHIVQLEPFLIDMSLTPLSFTDFRSGNQRIAFPVGNGKYAAGPQMLNPYPEVLSFSLPQGADTARYDLVLNDPELGELKGMRLADLINQEDITINNGDVQLAATITYPNIEAESYPLVVFVPGAGESTRQNSFSEYISLLPYYGVATLVYDKRGCGESTGDMRKSNFDDFASDVTAVVNSVKQLETIHAVGLLGIDQASYIMPIAAQRLPDLSFIIMLSGSAMSLKAQELQACELRLRADGYNDAEVEAALAYQKLMFDYLAGNADSLALQQAADAMESELWSSYVTSFNNKKYMEWWRNYHTVDPTESLKKLDLPVLALYGEQDVLLKTNEHANVLKEYIALNPDTVSRVITYPDANHFLILGESRGDFQFTEIVGYAPGVFNTINEWVVRRFGLLE